MRRKYFVLSILVAFLVSCGGGGGGGGAQAPAPGAGGAAAPSVNGDMLAVQQSRGWNYQGNTAQGQFTLTLYADPPSGSTTRMVAFSVAGLQSDATSGIKQAGIDVVNQSNGYAIASYTLYNSDGSISAAGTIPAGSLLVTSTLTQGQTFTPYPGMTATVTFIGQVPGANGCPTPANGATVTYTFQSQTYTISYVPGCGITQYVGNHGETFTLVSVGSYPQLGTQSSRRISR